MMLMRSITFVTLLGAVLLDSSTAVRTGTGLDDYLASVIVPQHTLSECDAGGKAPSKREIAEPPTQEMLKTKTKYVLYSGRQYRFVPGTPARRSKCMSVFATSKASYQNAKLMTSTDAETYAKSVGVCLLVQIADDTNSDQEFAFEYSEYNNDRNVPNFVAYKVLRPTSVTFKKKDCRVKWKPVCPRGGGGRNHGPRKSNQGPRKNNNNQGPRNNDNNNYRPHKNSNRRPWKSNDHGPHKNNNGNYSNDFPPLKGRQGNSVNSGGGSRGADDYYDDYYGDDYYDDYYGDDYYDDFDEEYYDDEFFDDDYYDDYNDDGRSLAQLEGNASATDSKPDRATMRKLEEKCQGLVDFDFSPAPLKTKMSCPFADDACLDKVTTRGHMAPVNSMAWDINYCAASMTFINVFPSRQPFDGLQWAAREASVVEYLQQFGHGAFVWLVVGVSRQSDGSIPSARKDINGQPLQMVEVPSFAWTAMYDPKARKATGWICRNGLSPHDKCFCMDMLSIRDMEARVGHRIFPDLEGSDVDLSDGRHEAFYRVLQQSEQRKLNDQKRYSH
eukprot:TRINITY_DN2651_c0_g1_i1.p1 TRINITY_DN2651_c0_g1~~TRINITY_DN2651_c0_g1_i1.p1  ORF type:complete len:556 (+),score=87.43 TRINITY_DN2651_c0_g1_i1:85-1752(+)